MCKVVEIGIPKVDPQSVAVLEELLASAKAGELHSLLFIDKYRNGECNFGWTGAPDAAMIGKLEEVKFDYFYQMYFPVEG